jgi:hypothetical protein
MYVIGNLLQGFLRGAIATGSLVNLACMHVWLTFSWCSAALQTASYGQWCWLTEGQFCHLICGYGMHCFCFCDYFANICVV